MRKLNWGFGLCLACSAGMAHAEWRRYETAHFIVYSASGDARAIKKATDLEKIDGLMRMATGLSSDVQPVKVRIYELGNEGDVQAALGGEAEGVAGFYSSNVLGPYAVTLRTVIMGDGDFKPDIVLHHEYAHHFMLQYFPAEYPGWYSEGFAELIGASKILDDGRVAYGYPAKYRGDTIAFGWVPVNEVLLTPADKLRMDWYGQGWALTHFLTFTKGRSTQLAQYLVALSNGKSQADAAKVFGNLEELNREAHAYLQHGSFEYKPVKVAIQQPVIQNIAPVPAAEAWLIPETAAFSDYDVRSIKKDDERQRAVRRRAALLERIRSKTAKFPNDPYALYFLSEAESSSGSKASAEAAIDRLLAVQPNNVRGLARKSLLLSDAAARLPGQGRLDKAAQARSFAVRANKAGPDEPLAYLAYYESFHSAGLKAPRNAVEGLEAAVDKLPDDTRIRRTLVEEYAAEHEWRAAIKTLEPIANDSHESPLRAEARERLAQLTAQLKSEGARPAASR